MWLIRLWTHKRLSVYPQHLMWKGFFLLSCHMWHVWQSGSIEAAVLSGWSPTIPLMNVATERMELKKRGSIWLWVFLACGKRGRGMYKPLNYLWPAMAFHYPTRPGKGELKGLFRNLSRQKATYQVSRSCCSVLYDLLNHSASQLWFQLAVFVLY